MLGGLGYLLILFYVLDSDPWVNCKKDIESAHAKAGKFKMSSFKTAILALNRLFGSGDTSPTLTLLLCDDEMSCPEEHLVIAVNMFTGRVICSVTCLNAAQRATLRELEKALYDNYNQDTIKRCLNRLKYAHLFSLTYFYLQNNGDDREISSLRYDSANPHRQ